MPVKIGSQESISSFQKPNTVKSGLGSEVSRGNSCGKSEIMIESKKRMRIGFGTSQESFTAENSRQVQISPKNQENQSKKSKKSETFTPHTNILIETHKIT